MQLLRKPVPLLGLAALTGLGLTARPAQAAPVTVANFSASNGSGTNAFSFDGTTLSVNPLSGLPGFLNQGAMIDAGSLVFGPITETGNIATAMGGGVAADFSGGTFTFTSSKAGNPVDLMGSFTSSQLTASSFGTGSATALNLSNVTYTGGSFLATLPPGTDLKSGAFSIGLSGVQDTAALKPGPTGTVGGKFNAFTAAGSSGTFSASPSSPSAAPEPSGTTVMLGLSLGMGGLLLRARRRRA